MNKRFFGLLALLAAALLAAGCPDGGDENDGDTLASFLAIATNDYVTGGAARMGTGGGDFTVKDSGQALDPDIGGMDAAGGRAFIVGRGGAVVYKFDVAGGMSLLDSFTVGGGLWASNPQDILVIDERKAYVSRYGEDDILIVDPRDGARLGNIPLSAYATNGDGLARPADMILAEGKVFVALQNLDAGFDYCDAAIENGLVAVIDPETDAVETAVPLNTADPARLLYSEERGRILIASAGQYATDSPGCAVYDPDPNVAVSGLEIMLPFAPYAVYPVIMGDAPAVNGNIFDVALDGPDSAYILVAEGFRNKDRALRVNIATGTVDPTFRYPAAPTGFDDLSGIAAAPGRLFIGDRANIGIYIHDISEYGEAGFAVLPAAPMTIQLLNRGE